MAVFSLTTWVKKALGWGSIDAQRSASDSYAGKVVSAETALTLSTVFACVRLVASTTASLSSGLFTIDANGDRIPSKDKDLNRILTLKPNADMTAFIFWQCVVASLLLWGNSYVLKKYRGTGANKKLISIEPLFPSCMAIQVNEDGSLTYKYTQSGSLVEYTEDDIAHFKGFSMSGKLGVSVISHATQTFGNALAVEETSGRFFSNGMRPGSALKAPQTLKGEQRKQIRESIVAELEGVAKSGGTIILEAGMEYEALGVPPQDAQMLESRKFSVEEICRWFGVPPVLIGHANITAWGTGIEQINLGYLIYSLGPLLENLEQQVRLSLIPATERDETFFDFDPNTLLRADSAGRAALYNSASQNGWMTRAEIRRKENLPFIPGSEKLTVQSALTPLDTLGETTSTPTSNKPVDDTSKV